MREIYKSAIKATLLLLAGAVNAVAVIIPGQAIEISAMFGATAIILLVCSARETYYMNKLVEKHNETY